MNLSLLKFVEKYNLKIDKEVIKRSYFGTTYYRHRQYSYLRFQHNSDSSSFIDVYIGPSIYENFKIVNSRAASLLYPTDNKYPDELPIKSLFLQHLGLETIDKHFLGYRIEIWIPEDRIYIASAPKLLAVININDK